MITIMGRMEMQDRTEEKYMAALMNGTPVDDTSIDASSMYIAQDDRIGLMPMAYEDCGRIVDWRNDPSVRQHYIYREDFTLEHEREYYLENIVPGHVHIQMICDKLRGGRKVGCTVLYEPDADGASEYGMFIGSGSERGCGIGRRAAALTMEYAFETLGFQKLTARVFTDNVASRRSCLAAGFREEGLIRDVVCSDGEIKDMIYFEACPDDWKRGCGQLYKDGNGK